MSKKVTDQLDHFGGQDPPTQHRVRRIVVSSSTSDDKVTPRERPEQRGVVKQGEIDHARQVYGVHAPRLGPPDGPTSQACRVAAPGGASPPKTLREKFWVRADRGLDHGFGVVLDLDLPPGLHDRARDVIVVVGVEGPEPTEKEGLV